MIFIKHNNTVDLIVTLVDTVAECIKTAGMAVESYIEGNLSEATDQALSADALALDANQKMGDILNRLGQGNVVAPIRENLYLLAIGFNRLADVAASCSLFFIDRRPDIPLSVRREFINFTATVFGGCPDIKAGALNCLKGGWRQGKNREPASKFGSVREEARKIRRDLYCRISELDNACCQQVILDTCQVEVNRVFDQMVLTAETITRINVGLGN